MTINGKVFKAMRTMLSMVAGFLLAFSGYSQNIQLKKYHEENQSLKELYFVIDTTDYILDGEYISYYANGKVKTRGDYKRNNAVGIWEYFFESGAIKMKGDLKEGGDEAYWEYYFENGEKNMEGSILHGKRTGEWKFYFEQGGIKNTGHFTDGQRIGRWEYFNEDGSLKAEADYKNDSGIYTEYYRSGNIKSRGMNFQGKSEGVWSFFYENNKLKATGEYRNGVKVGKWKYFHDNGKLASEGYYENGISDGKWVYYHENGAKSAEGIEKEGAKDGFWKLYHKSGVYKGESTFIQGEGPYKEYYESGNLKIEGYIKNEKNHGNWRYYYEDGTLEGECNFVEGVGQFKGYYKNQQLRMEGTIKDGLNVGIWKLYKPNGELAGYYTTVYNDDGVPEYARVDADSLENITNTSYEIPEFLFKNRKVRYFQPKINEFKGIIIASNPVAMSIGAIPFSIEYYMQERLGYELLLNYVNDPFFKPHSSVPFNELYKRGFEVRFRQKFYQSDQQIGMLYFGHEISFSSIRHFSNISDNTLPNGSFSIDALEQKYEYAVIVGNRMMKYAGKPGVTLDIFGGIGLGYREYTEQFPTESAFREIFRDVRKTKLSIPIRFGFNIGYAF